MAAKVRKMIERAENRNKSAFLQKAIIGFPFSLLNH